MICQEDHDQILADPNATTDELRGIIAELQPYYASYRRIIDADTKRDLRRNDTTRVTATQFKQRWTAADDEKVMSSSLKDMDLAKVIGRSLKAIQRHRWALRKRSAP
jgi:hypothetical protein